MTRTERPPRPEDRAIDPVSTAGYLSALSGVASLGWPFFEGLTLSLSALGLVGWLVGGRRRNGRWRHPAALAAIAASLAGWVLFLAAPTSWGAGRALGVGLSAGLVGWVGRSRPPFGEGR